MRSEKRPRYHHGALEPALVDEAVRQVRERGADQVSLRGLAQTIGVSPSAAYQHFPDKAALLYAVCGAGFTELTRRMTEAVDAVTAEGDTGAIGRFLAVGRVYLDFAVAETHLFRHMFSASSAKSSQFTPPDDYLDVRWEPGVDPHDLLLARIGELADRGLLRLRAEQSEALDVLAWSLVHGFASLVVEEMLPLESAAAVLDLFGRLALTDEGYARFAAAVDAAAPAAG
jgi:AcrR family transcriptional regulator